MPPMAPQSQHDYHPITGIQVGLDDRKDDPLREVPLRLELDDWYQSTKAEHVNQRALFFPAMKKFMDADPFDKLSYFQVAGIHGKPLVSWDEPNHDPLEPGRGYCAHDSILFATWHRPYLMLFEQILFELMEAEVKHFDKDERPELLEDLQSWRLPYWDWALKRMAFVEGKWTRTYSVPSVFQEVEVTIRRPRRVPSLGFPNALYQFNMPYGWKMGDAKKLGDLAVTPRYLDGNDKKTGEKKRWVFPYDECTATSRHSSGPLTWARGEQNNVKVGQSLEAGKLQQGTGKGKSDEEIGKTGAVLRDAFYRILQVNTFGEFATKRAENAGTEKENPRKQWSSSEALHDNIHGWIGGNVEEDAKNSRAFLGHMSYVPVAAFDPIFWFHHCNCDRMIAIWQTLHTDTWFDGTSPRDEDPGSFYIKKGHKDTPDDELRPFRKNEQGEYWTSTDCKDVAALGYTYPLLEKWKYVDADGNYARAVHLAALNKELNETYNSARAAAIKAEVSPSGTAPLPLPNIFAKIDAKELNIDDQLVVNDYAVNVIYEKFDLGGAPFTISIFVGRVPTTVPYSYQEAETSLIGEVYNFSTEAEELGSSSEGCGNCRQQQAASALSAGRVVLTNALITRWKAGIVHHADPSDDGAAAGDDYVPVLHSMDPADVVPFLRANLHWRVVSSTGALVNVASLRVSLVVGRAKHFVADVTRPSVFSDYKPAYSVTAGRPNGAAPEDELYTHGVCYDGAHGEVE
ncbi:hypothetical protein B0T26DRAFT_876116 [Lasiosphaeria miniovina]|uniref:tyrosinase n=1 Tax=Lasiosphaeria miniovina TaxID=1954250 RepID=A0AA40DL14_9PEZI|nr:uncharacterized protein B0T26DRAFT_876116 [Lasiosphaeria miniovina]KAK0707120.1 hypothetical protein B0T26DRAFT_876116 [Lasiosphaeria miniovina]